jgi:hypothetical protein
MVQYKAWNEKYPGNEKMHGAENSCIQKILPFCLASETSFIHTIQTETSLQMVQYKAWNEKYLGNEKMRGAENSCIQK